MNGVFLTWEFIEKIAVALAIGALLGMEREYTKKQVVVGLRTFALISLLGALFVEFAELTGDGLQIVLGFVAVMLLVAVLYASNLFKFKAVGMTTSIALLMSYVLGVFVAYGRVTEAVFVAIATAIVMFAKDWMHKFVRELSSREVLDFLEFLILVGIIYPLVPQEPIVLYSVVINIMDIWLLVFMLALINFAGFVGSRYISGKEQMELMSLLGGLVSSTAVLYSMTQAYAKNKEKEVILSSSYMFINASMFFRNLVILAVLLPASVDYLAPPIIASSLFLIAAGYWTGRGKAKAMKISLSSPFQVKKAASLVVKLAVVLVALEVVIVYLPDIFYIATFFGGITSSASTMASFPVLVETGRITVRMAVIGASIAVLGDLLVGNIIVYYLGGAWESAKRALPWGLAATAIYGVILALLVGI
ncbi:MAG: MgtC/SapB family protein [Candidatus Diapherotrites archaeon]|nr:MgtC/SapB family protein [Candidatus Diapherotrites archaeon]